MTDPRANWASLEAIAVIAIALVPWPAAISVALPLVIAAAASRWLRHQAVISGATWRGAARGALAGAGAVAIAIAVSTDDLAALSQRSFEWSQQAISGHDPLQFAIVAVHVAVVALAMEVALRGWIVERVLELSPGSPVLPIMTGAFAEAAVTPGSLAGRIGIGVFAIGLGWLYCARRDVAAPIAARVVFQLAALFSEWFAR